VLQLLDLSGLGIWGPQSAVLFGALHSCPGLELVIMSGASMSSAAAAEARNTYATLPGHILLDPQHMKAKDAETEPPAGSEHGR
jgi:hypothetical protein